MYRHPERPFRIDEQVIMLGELRLRELHQEAARDRLARAARGEHRPAWFARPVWPRLPGTWVWLWMRARFTRFGIAVAGSN